MTTRTCVRAVAWVALVGGIAGAAVACGNSTQNGGSSEDGGDDGSQAADGSLGTDAPTSDATQGQDGTTGDGATGNDAHGMSDVTSGDAEGGSANDGGSTDATPDAIPDAATDASTDALPDASDGAAACSQVLVDGHAPCNSLCNTAPVVPVAYSTQVPPTGTGGTPLAGTYYASAVTYYFAPDSGVEAGTSSETIQGTSFLSAPQPVGTIESVLSQNGGPNDTSNFQLAVSGSDLLMTQTCSSTGQLAVQYSVSGNTITVYIPSNGPNGPYWAGETLTLQSPADAGTPFEAGPPPADASCPMTYSDAQVTCTTMCNEGPVISVIGVPGSPPAPTGGTVADGKYYLTARTSYEGADGGADGGALYTIQETFVITTSGGITILQDTQNNHGNPEETNTIAIVTSGNSLYLTGLCPAGIQGQQGYTVSGNTLSVYEAHGSNGSIDVSVFTLQP